MTQLKGIPAALGIAIGPLFKYLPAAILPDERTVDDTAGQWERLQSALTRAEEQLKLVQKKALEVASAKDAEIFDAQAAMLRDPELLELCSAELEQRHVNIEAAWHKATEHYASLLEEMADPYLRARAADIRDVADRVLCILVGVDDQSNRGPSEPSIIVALDLTPSDTISMDKARVLGFCIAAGGETSHTAILARSLGLPAVVGAGAGVLDVSAEHIAILSGSDGFLLVDPTPADLEQWQEKKRQRDSLNAGSLRASHEPASTIDGRHVEIVANIGSLSDARSAVDNGAEGVGLLRTEFLYLERSALPDEGEQLQAYAAILDLFGTRPVVLRTLDIGGDKAVPYLKLGAESNPFLGVRGLRLCLSRPDLFKPQLRAALQAAVGHNLKIMFPMVATLDEVLRARRQVDECRQELQQESRPVAEGIEIGIMVEVPSAAVMADLIAPAVDFFSIGTNDLTQYTLAADRTNTQVSYLSSAFSPAVLRLIDGVIRAGHEHGKWVGVCGELAGEPLAIPILLGLELDEFSMNAPAIPLAKQIIRSLSVDGCRQLAQRVLSLDSPSQVRDLVRQSLPQINI